MILTIFYTDNTTETFDLEEYKYVAGMSCITIVKKDDEISSLAGIPYANIYKWTIMEKD